MFDFFKSSTNEKMINELKDTVKNANELNQKERTRVAINVRNQILKYISEIEGLPKPSEKVDLICKRQLMEAMTNRQNAITSLGAKNPDWIQAALIESFIHGNIGFTEKKRKTTKVITEIIFEFIRNNTEQFDK
jgi:hypothetical protein